MDEIDLEASLERPQCSRCKTGRIRPIAIDGTHVMFNCPKCQWRPLAPLPDIKKTIVYLDTSTVSNIASAKRKGKAESKWLALYEALRESAANDVICCVDSSIIQREAELSRYAADIVAMSRQFGDPRPRREGDVTIAQLFRAVDRFLTGSAPLRETSLPWKDAFEKNPHRWHELFRIDVDYRYTDASVNSMRARKASLQHEIKDIYTRYQADALDFEGIRRLEAAGFGRGIIEDGQRAIMDRLSTGTRLPVASTLGMLLPTTFDIIIHALQQRLDLPYLEAIGKTMEFLKSEHVECIPVADISSRLHAALAMDTRGQNPRQLKESDTGDIAHMATFMPYVDIFIADRYFASLCNRPGVDLGLDYGTEIRSLGGRDIDGFIAKLGQLRESCPHAGLSRRIQQSIEEGGYIQERTEKLRQWLRAQGIDPDHPDPTKE